ncbi:MAG: DUF4417 domain-containing protein [Candidatus Beckwithbacteria bacterium]|nr:DUF4417 domain-containing protein [Candidatus Beckwithbacteria bacterium]
MDEKITDQLEFWGLNGLSTARISGCPVVDYLDDCDSACYPTKPSKYEALTCGSKKGAQFLGDARGATLNNIKALRVKIPKLPIFIPELQHGSKYLVNNTKLDWVAVKIDEVVSKHDLKVAADIRKRIGIDSKTKVLLLGYGSDRFLENLWTNRKKIFPQIASLKADLYTAIDYSVFLVHPHLERVLNVKRSLVTFDILQRLGVPVVPHIYWSGEKDMKRWAFWLNQNSGVNLVSMYLGWIRKSEWVKIFSELKCLNKSLERKINYLISGPGNLTEIKPLKEILGNVILTDAECALNAAHHKLSQNKLKVTYYPFKENLDYHTELVKAA